MVITKNDGFKGVRYEKLTSLLIQANKELIQRVEELEEKLKEKIMQKKFINEIFSKHHSFQYHWKERRKKQVEKNKKNIIHLKFEKKQCYFLKYI